MPVVTVTISKKLDRSEKEALAFATIDAVVDGMKKPRDVVMSIVNDDTCISYQSNCKLPAAFVNIQCVGPTSIQARQKTVELFCDLLKEREVDPVRIYIKINDSDLPDWGTNSSLLG